MAWLGMWAKRKKITVDNTNIGSDLTHFPVPILLGVSVGESNQDVSDIFDDLGSNSKKIAITKSDGTTQIYGEIELWDESNENAVIWVSKSDLTLSSSATTDLYIYFDSSQSDNTTFIGETTDTQAQNVWDSDSGATYLMAQDPSGGTDCILDSTINANHGTPTGSMTSGDLVDGDIGKAIDFDGTDDAIECSDTDQILDGATEFTILAKIKIGDLPASGERICIFTTFGGTSSGQTTDTEGLELHLEGVDTGVFKCFHYYNSSGNADTVISTTLPAANTSYSLAIVKDAFNLKLFLNGVLEDTVISNGAVYEGNNFFIGCRDNNGTLQRFWTGSIDCLQVSLVAKSADWIKAANYALNDSLIAFSATETYSGASTAITYMATDIQVWQEKVQSISLDLSAGYQDVESCHLDLQAAIEITKDFSTDIELSNGTITVDMAMDISVGDGNKTQTLGMDLIAVSTLPEFKSIYAMNLNTIIKEVV